MPYRTVPSSATPYLTARTELQGGMPTGDAETELGSAVCANFACTRFGPLVIPDG